MRVSRMNPGLVLLVVAAGCGGTRQADVSADTRAGDSSEAAPRDVPAHVAADAEFMRGMIGHHQQAIDMASLVADRSDSENMALLARRIDESQVFEIGLMQKWLAARGLDSAMSHGMAEMAGMATPEQMADLARAEGDSFDQLFLELMIRHHEGAIVMVKTLSAEGGGQELEVFNLVSHIDADQVAEIARMQRMLNELQ